MSKPEPTMNDYTDIVCGPDTEEWINIGDNHGAEKDPFSYATSVTVEMIRKRPDIRQSLLEPLKDILLPWEDEDEDEPDDYLDQQLVNAINLDPFIQTTVFECLNGIGDITEQEGNEMYFPSIFQMDSVEEIMKQEQRGGFQEDNEGIPAKYVHLSPQHQDMIYTHPETRKFLSNLPIESITEEFVEQLCRP